MKIGLTSLLFLMLLTISFPIIVAKGVHAVENPSVPDDKQGQIEQIETDLSHQKEQYQEFGQKEKGLLGQLSVIEKEVNEKKILLGSLSRNIQIAQEELKKQKDTLDSIETSYNKIKNLLNKRLGAFYKYSKRAYLRVVASTNDLTQLNHMIKYLRVIFNKDLMTMKQASKEYQDYRKQVSLVEKRLKTISDMKVEESNNILSLKAEVEKKVILLSRVHKEKEFYETAVKELGSAEEHLKNTIRDLDYKQDNTAALPTGFAVLKGKLPLPVKGKILRSDGQSGDNIFSNLKGIYIRGPFGEDVRSVFQGRVDYSGQLKGYGQVIVINHGERFFSVSAYLSRRNKTEGEMVKRGEIIGQVGETGLLAGPALYFEMRKGDSNLDPLKWLKVN